MIAYLSGGMENFENKGISCSSRTYGSFDNLKNGLLRIYTIDR